VAVVSKPNLGSILRKTGMSYRNKTYVAFASEGIHCYRLMEAWRDNEKIDFNFHNAHDLATARDSSLPETIRGRLRERLNNTKQVVVLGSAKGKSKAGDGKSFFYYEIETVVKLNLLVVIANLDGDRTVDRNFIPKRFLDEDYYTISVSFQPKIIQYALEYYASKFTASNNSGRYFYKSSVYERLGL
jgi:hypothetical protein